MASYVSQTSTMIGVIFQIKGGIILLQFVKVLFTTVKDFYRQEIEKGRITLIISVEVTTILHLCSWCRKVVCGIGSPASLKQTLGR